MHIKAYAAIALFVSVGLTLLLPLGDSLKAQFGIAFIVLGAILAIIGCLISED